MKDIQGSGLTFHTAREEEADNKRDVPNSGPL